MGRGQCLLGLAAVGLGLCTATATPSPVSVEEMKARAEVVILATMGRIEALGDPESVHCRIGITPLLVCAGSLADAVPKRELRQLYLLFPRPPAGAGRGPIHKMVVGGMGTPQPKEGESALLFLRATPTPDGYVTVAGAAGYIGLGDRSQEARAAARKKIRELRRWCRRVKDRKARAALSACYERALELIEGGDGEGR